MDYGEVCRARFLARPNRFIATVELGGRELTVHVKNTGRCRELLLPGATVYLAKGRGPGRKTAYDLVAVEKGGLLINMDAQAPNQVVAEYLQGGRVSPPLLGFRREYAYGGSRLDFCLATEAGPYLLEVKGVTLEAEGTALFPDAPTARGAKHLKELRQSLQEGYRAGLLFVLQFAGARYFTPNRATDPVFAAALQEAAAAGVEVRAAECAVTPGSMVLGGEVEVRL